MKQILYFTFSCIILFCPEDIAAQDKIAKNRGFRFGIDLSDFVMPLCYPETKGYEFLADIQVTDDIFVAGEFGVNKTTLDTDSYSFNYDLDGWYMKIGINRNMLKNDEKFKDYSNMEPQINDQYPNKGIFRSRAGLIFGQ